MSLIVKEISFGYTRSKQILKNISFFIERGKTMGIIGVSGTGKSTLLKVIADFMNSTEKKNLSGEVLFENQSLATLKSNGRFSFMFQEPTLMPNLNVWQNITLPFKILQFKLSTNIDKIIELVGLQNFRDSFPNELSGGMKTRVSLARSFITNPELLLLDEPFSSLDIGWKNKLYKELEQLQKINSTTVLIVSHDLEEVLRISDKIILIGYDGTIIYSKDAISKNPTIEDIQSLKQIILDNYTTRIN